MRRSPVRIVKAFGMENTKAGVCGTEQILFNSFMRSIKTSALSHPVMEFISMLGTSMVIVYGIYSIGRGVMTVGEFFSFMMALVFFYRPLKELNGINSTVQDGLAAAKRIFEVLDTKPEIQDRPDAVAVPRDFKTIEFHDVSFQYEDDL
jgi:subfamily B ATP-binding cassette protein MsbA